MEFVTSPGTYSTTASWESNAPDIVEVTQAGRITALREGMAYIKVTTDNGKSATCKVTALRPGTATITATTNNGCEDSFTLTVPAPAYQLFVWMKSGEKTGYRFEQKPEFTLEGETVHFTTEQVAFDIQKDDLDKFTVEQVLPEHPTDISLVDHLTVGLGKKVHLTYTLTPVNAQTKVTWFNSNPEVVSIDNNGWLQGLQVGTATLKAQTSNGLRATCRVTVPEPLYHFYVWLHDGRIEGYAIEEKPQVTMGEELFTLSTTSATVVYEAKNVRMFTLNDAAVDDLITTAITPVAFADTEMAFHGGEFSISNGRANTPVMVYNLQGRLLSSQRISPDGTKVYYKAEEVSSIGVYGYGEEPEPEPEEPEGNVFTANGVSFTMVAIEGGTFLMGSDDSDAYDREKPVHQVKLSSFSIGQTEVTQELWEAVMGSNPSDRKGWKLPVEQVSWNDCQTFITKLNQLTGKQFRLPTEAEWEFAARGGNISKGYKYSGSDNIDDVAWYDSNSGNQTHEVATKQPNELGLFDMSGNVWEWCQDWYGNYSSNSQTNPTGPSSASDRVYRGGSWCNGARYCRVSNRFDLSPVNRNYLGLRLAL